jgi:transposase
LTPQLQKAFCAQLVSGCTYETAAAAIEVSKSAITQWMAKGRTQERGKYADFLRAVEKARAEVVQRLLARAQKRVMSRKEGGIDADPLPLLAILDRSYAPQVRIQVATELSATLDRLEAEFANEPEIYERILAAIAEETGPGAVAPASRARTHEDARGGAAVGARDAVGATEDLPQP